MVVEPTSGNTGIALAMVCAARGYELILTLPEGMSRERAKLLRAYGAEVRETPSLGGMNEAVALAEEIREQRKAFMPMQFSNPANAEAHRRTTAEEIWRDTDGAGRRLRRRRRHRRHDHRRRADAEGTGAGGAGRRGRAGRLAGPLRRRARPAQDPGDRRRLRPRGARPLGDRRDRLAVSDEDALETARLVAREEGILAGISAGANIRAALEIAARPEMAGKRVVTIVCDSGERYMSLPFFSP